MIRRWFKKLTDRHPQAFRPRRHTRLEIEQLEGRELPSVMGVSVTPPGVTGDGESHIGRYAFGGVSADGRYVAFVSAADNLVPGQIEPNRGNQVFLRDTVAKTTTLVSHAYTSAVTAANSVSDHPVISADGRYVAYESFSHNLVNEGTNDQPLNVFVYDQLTGSNTLVSHTAGNPTREAGGSAPAISSDGNWIAFSSIASNLVSGITDNNYAEELFLYNVPANSTQLITFDGQHPNQPAKGPYSSANYTPVLSADGRYVAYVSSAGDLDGTVTDTNWAANVFRFDRVARTNTLISRAASTVNGIVSGNGDSYAPSISADGLSIAFTSAATNLVLGQSGFAYDNVFLSSPSTGLILVSHAVGGGLNANRTFFQTGDGDSDQPVISADGSAVAFVSRSTDLVANQSSFPGQQNVFLFSVGPAGQNTLVSHAYGSPATAANSFSSFPSISADGKAVAFWSTSSNLVAGQTSGGQNVFGYDAWLGAVHLMSHIPGSDSTPGSGGGTDAPVISGSGKFIAFASQDTNLVSGDGNGTYDVFIADNPLFNPRFLVPVTINPPFNPRFLVPVTMPAGAPPTGTAAPVKHPLFATLITLKVGKQKRLMVEVFFADSGILAGEFLSPFQGPGYQGIQVRAVEGNGGLDQLILLAQKGRKTVSQVVPLL
jgi:Tol biopolymer transport system component